MVVVFSGAGNHSNRLFQNIHFEAFCKENEIEFRNPSFRDMDKFYGLKGSFLSKPFCFLLQKINKTKLIKVLDCNNNEENELYCRTILNNQLVLTHGWNFRVPPLTKKHQDYFINKYTLLPKFYQENTFYKTFNQINRKDFTLVGVHLRRGDYKNWLNGKYYFMDDVYEKYMDNLSDELINHSQKKPFFIIFSNEKINMVKKENMLISNNEWYIDQMIMSKCDYLIGPPSTFTLWASYIGKVKYFHFEDGSGKIKIKDFGFCRS